MNWEQLWKEIEENLFQQLCIIAVTIVTWLYRKQLKKFEQSIKDQSAQRKAMIALLRDRFYEGYKKHVRNGYYPIRDREILQDIYSQYHAQGGNGVISHLMNELEDLPTYPCEKHNESGDISE